MAVVESCDGDGNAILTQRNKFSRGDELELLTNDGFPVSFRAEELFDGEGNAIESARCAVMTVRMKLPHYAGPLSIVRKALREPLFS